MESEIHIPPSCLPTCITCHSLRFEWNKTVKVHGPDGLHLIGLDAKARKEIVATMDISKASCQYQEDHDAILEDIARQAGSVEAFNDALRLQLLLQPDSYKVRSFAFDYDPSSNPPLSLVLSGRP